MSQSLKCSTRKDATKRLFWYCSDNPRPSHLQESTKKIYWPLSTSSLSSLRNTFYLLVPTTKTGRIERHGDVLLQNHRAKRPSANPRQPNQNLTQAAHSHTHPIIQP